MTITEISIIHHVAIVIFLLWLLDAFSYGRPLFYFLSFLYLYQVNERYVMRLSRKFRFEQRRQAYQKRVLRESESVRWLNHAIEKIWPVCMEQIVSQKILLPIIPWFLDKYKPWTIKKASVEHLYLGRKPPIFTEMRVLHESSDDDHLVLELGLNFLTADDMSAILAAKLRKALGFGIVTKMHITSMHVEGKVLVGVKFIRDWPYISRLRICFAEPPYFQMTVKPIFNHGFDVTEVPGVAGWLDNLLAVAFEETLVEASKLTLFCIFVRTFCAPNMLVVDMEKFVSPQPSSKKANWFSVSAKEPIAYARVEVIEGSNMKPSDFNGLADPFVKGQLGLYRFKTKIQRKTLAPKWLEEFKIPICSWESDIVLTLEVRDKDHFTNDNLGVCSVDISEYKDGQRHDIWLPLDNIKMGRLHLAVTVVQADSKDVSNLSKDENLHGEGNANPIENQMEQKVSGSSGSTKNSHKFGDTFEPVDFVGQKETGMWVHHPGSEASQKRELRKGKSRRLTDTKIQAEGESDVSTPESSTRQSHNNSDEQGNKSSRHHNIFTKGLHMVNKALRRSHNKEDSSSVSSTEPVPSPDDQECIPDKAGKSTPQIKPSFSSKGSKYFPRPSDVESQSSDDDDSVSDENVVEGLPIPSVEETNNGDKTKMNLGQDNAGDTHCDLKDSVQNKTIKTMHMKRTTNDVDGSTTLPMREALKPKDTSLGLLSLTYLSNATPTLPHTSCLWLVFKSPGSITYISRAMDRASTTASSKAEHPPCPKYGPMTCMASPATVTLPLLKLLSATSFKGR
ncbi:hypothetical protein V2J09_008630 [Rumex salicifolius]